MLLFLNSCSCCRPTLLRLAVKGSDNPISLEKPCQSSLPPDQQRHHSLGRHAKVQCWTQCLPQGVGALPAISREALPGVFHLISRGTTLSGDIQRSSMLFEVYRCVQLNRWSVVCGCVLHRGQRGEGWCISSTV